MPDTSISGLPASSSPASDDLMVLLDVDGTVGSKTQSITLSGLASALRDLIEEADAAEHGSLYVSDNSTAQDLTADTWAIIDHFVTGECDGVTAGTNNLTIETTGGYDVGISVSWQGGNNITFEVAVFVNGSEVPAVEFWRKMGTAGDIGNGGARNILELTAGDEVDVRIMAVALGGSITVKAAQLSLHRIF